MILTIRLIPKGNDGSGDAGLCASFGGSAAELVFTPSNPGRT